MSRREECGTREPAMWFYSLTWCTSAMLSREMIRTDGARLSCRRKAPASDSTRCSSASVEKARMIEWSGNRTHVLLNPRMPLADQERLGAARTVGAAPGAHRHRDFREHRRPETGRVVEGGRARFGGGGQRAAGGDGLRCLGAGSFRSFTSCGLGIDARAHLAGSRVVAMSWNPQASQSQMPRWRRWSRAQVHDLVNSGLTPPSRLRAILVGAARWIRISMTKRAR